jgi:beta-glucosidase
MALAARARCAAFALVLAAAASAAATASAADPPAWRNASLPFADRVASLIAAMNLTEKVLSMGASPPAIARIGLPAFSYARECERGDTSGPRGTAYPSGAGLAASWDAELVASVASATAVEARANSNAHGGFSSCFGPVLNFVHDARWGRTAEMLGGEDVTLGGALAAAWVRGLQSHRAPAGAPGEEYVAAVAVAKHLNAYSGPEGYGFTFGPFARRFSFEVALPSTRADREFFLPMFRAAVEAGCENAMSSYSAVTGAFGQQNVPASASSALLTSVFRGEWGAPGFVISDAGAVAFVGHVLIGGIPFGHGYAADDEGSAVAAVSAGLDIELTCCGAPAVFATLPAAVSSGRLAESDLDASLARSLRARFQLGVLDAGVPFAAWNDANVSTAADIALARAAADAGVVMLKNLGGLLPLDAASLAGRTVAVIGPNANNSFAQLGGYVNTHPPFIVTPFDGLAAALPQARVLLDAACPDTACETYSPTAVALAASADIVIAVLGTTGYYKPGANNESAACGCPQSNAIEGECCDRTDASLPGAQLPLLQALAALGKPLIVVLVSGGSLDVGWLDASPAVGAVLHAPFLGQSSGEAVSRVITGAVNPSARTTLTWYATLATALPPLGDYSALYRSTYRYVNSTATPVVYPFGWGLSFGPSRTFAGLSVSPAAPDVCESINVSVTVSNPGPSAGYEIVQLYGTLAEASVAPVPTRQLLAFAKVLLQPRSDALVTLTVPPGARTVFVGDLAAEVVEPGLIELWLGSSSDPGRSEGVRGSVRISGASTPLPLCRSLRARGGGNE